MRVFAALLMMVTSAIADPIVVPSGISITFVDVIKDVPGSRDSTWRYRFLAPALSRDLQGTIATDLDTICVNFVLPDLSDADLVPQLVVISISDQWVDFGVATPDAIQFFEAYRIEDQHCVWVGL